jgi:uncharacterized membrane-anchored protein
MKNNTLSRLALAGIPWLILAGMIIGAYLPIFRGQKYLLPVKPRDPRDFFRGNYVDLGYEFSNLSRSQIDMQIDNEKTYRFGDRLYLGLKLEDGYLKPKGLYDSAEKVKDIKLKVQPRWNLDKTNQVFDLVSGLESFFAPKQAAEDWEKALRNGHVFAEVAIDSGGNARLTQLVVKKIPVKKAEGEEN